MILITDLIDREELMRKHTTSSLHNNKHNTVDELQVLLKLINDAPTINVEPVMKAYVLLVYYEKEPTIEGVYSSFEKAEKVAEALHVIGKNTPWAAFSLYEIHEWNMDANCGKGKVTHRVY